MIAPNATQRQVYLPAGTWYDFWTNAKHTGGQTVNWTNANQMQFPLFVREGAIVPMLPEGVQTLCDGNYVNNPAIVTPDDSLILLIYPAADSAFTAHDGTVLRCQSSGTVKTVTVRSVPRRMVIQLFGDVPHLIARDGATLTKVANQGALDVVDAGWHYDAASRFSFVKFPHPGGSVQITART
jgi:alpha-glucosidase (family GH31 glycosyl hydrolase)